MDSGKKDKAQYIKVHAENNVAIVVNEGGLPKGAKFSDGLVLKEPVPQGHKVALKDFRPGDPIIRYGMVIGYVTRSIPKGRWVDETAVEMPAPPDLDTLLVQLPKETFSVQPFAPPSFKSEPCTFEGYRNADGTVACKNLLGLVPSVQCMAGVLKVSAARIEKELLPRYPHVDGVVALNHSYGYGVAISAAESEIPIRTIQNLASHPHFGGLALIVSLGCEKLQPVRIATAPQHEIIRLQDQAGFSAMVAHLMRVAESRLAILDQRRREPCPISDLVVGVQCGGSDAFSGVTANPAIGYASDLLVRAGATVMFSEVTEVRDAVHLLVPRAVSSGVAQALIRGMKWYDEYLARSNVDRSANPAPGNKKGGLSNIVEKALGSAAKSGMSPIVEVLAPGERVSREQSSQKAMHGLYFAATPASDFICGTLQLASGIHVQVFSTGRGTPYGLAMAPVIKVSSNSRLAHQWPDLIDIDAGGIAESTATIEEVGQQIFDCILDVASGQKKTWANIHGLYNDLVLFDPGPVT